MQFDICMQTTLCTFLEGFHRFCLKNSEEPKYTQRKRPRVIRVIVGAVKMSREARGRVRPVQRLGLHP